MAIWKILVLGNQQAVTAGNRVVILPNQAWALIGSLLAAPRRNLNRNQIATELWPDRDEDSARHCLATTLWRIKRQLGSFDMLLDVSENRIAMAGKRSVWIDALAFERRVVMTLDDPDRLDSAPERNKLRRAMTLYRGDFLPQREQDAIAIERERLRGLYLDAGLGLARACARHGEWRAALELCRALCLADPLREDAQQLLMEALIQCGHRNQALQQYREFERVLMTELSLNPMRETTAIVQTIAEAPRDIDAGPARQQALVKQARAHLNAALDLIERLIAH